jgi:hypothetical protein
MATPAPTPTVVQTIIVRITQVPAPHHGFWHFDGVGDLATWVVGLLTAGSLLLGFSILRRDRRDKRREQAAKVTAWIRHRAITGGAHGDAATLYITNSSAGPLVTPVFAAFGRLASDIQKDLRDLNPANIVELLALLDGVTGRISSPSAKTLGVNDSPELPQGATSQAALDLAFPAYFYDYYLSFSDGQGRTWTKDFQTMKLVEGTPHSRYRSWQYKFWLKSRSRRFYRS